MGDLFPGAVPWHETVTCSLNATTKCSAGVTVSPGDATGRREADAPSVLPRPSVSGSGETPGATVTGGNLRARRDQQTVTMTSSDMQDTPAGRRAARADGPRSSQPKRRTFTAAYKMAMIEKYDAATEPGAKGVL